MNELQMILIQSQTDQYCLVQTGGNDLGFHFLASHVVRQTFYVHQMAKGPPGLWVTIRCKFDDGQVVFGGKDQQIVQVLKKEQNE